MFVREELMKTRLKEKGDLFILKTYDYTGAIHLHSDYSHDGRRTIEEIVSAARRNSIDFLMLTDHNWHQARYDGREKWYGDVLVMVGVEVTPRYNHYIAFGVDEPLIVCDIPWVFPYDEDIEVKPQFYIDWVRGRGGIGFIAHPDHEGALKFHVKQHPWLDWGVTGYTGIGIWDFMTDWQSKLNGYASAIFGYLFPAYILKGPKQITLTRWDEFSRYRKIVGIGELDNHDTVKKLLGIPFEIFPFHRAFRFVTTHILTETPFFKDESLDRNLILSALKRGRAYIALEYFQPAKGFSFIIMDETEVATMGDDFFLDDMAILRVYVPAEAKIRIIKDGELVNEEVTESLVMGIDQAGVYRVEVFLKRYLRYRPWIFSNPIYVK
jgi:hypothetical protein